MSPLLHDELRVVLYPDHAVVVRLAKDVSLRGVKRSIRSKAVVFPLAGAGTDAPWDGALRGLAAAVAAQAGRKADATVILSNHFVHYVLVPWSDSLSDEGEEIALAGQCFKGTFGEAANEWEPRVSFGTLGSAQLASAVDRRLLAALRAAFDYPGVTLASVQPHVMAAYNACRPLLRHRSAWFVVCEHGNLCLVLLRGGVPGAVKSLRTDRDWREELPLVLESESCLAGTKTDIDEVLLWAPAAKAIELPNAGRWKFKHLQVPLPPEFMPVGDHRFTVPLATETP